MKFIKQGFNKDTGKEWAIAKISDNKYELWYKQGDYLKNWSMDAKGNLVRMIEIFNLRMSAKPKKDKCYLDLLEVW